MYVYTSKPLTMIGIDPGTTFLGLSVMEMDPTTMDILSLSAHTLNAPTLLTRSTNYVKRAELDYIERTENIIVALKRLLGGQDNVFCFCYETSHFDSRKPGSFKILAVHLNMVISALKELYPHSECIGFAPMTIKSMVGAKSMRGKDPVREAVLTNKVLMKVLTTHPDKLTEHSIDAIATVYTRYMKLMQRKK